MSASSSNDSSQVKLEHRISNENGLKFDCCSTVTVAGEWKPIVNTIIFFFSNFLRQETDKSDDASGDTCATIKNKGNRISANASLSGNVMQSRIAGCL